MQAKSPVICSKDVVGSKNHDMAKFTISDSFLAN